MSISLITNVKAPNNIVTSPFKLINGLVIRLRSNLNYFLILLNYFTSHPKYVRAEEADKTLLFRS